MPNRKLTVIAEVHGGVEPGLTEDHHPCHLVKEDVVVERQHVHQAHPPHQRDGIPQDKKEHENSVEVDTECVGPREHEEIVGLGAITVVPKPDDINHDDREFVVNYQKIKRTFLYL